MKFSGCQVSNQFFSSSHMRLKSQVVSLKLMGNFLMSRFLFYWGKEVHQLASDRPSKALGKALEESTAKCIQILSLSRDIGGNKILNGLVKNMLAVPASAYHNIIITKKLYTLLCHVEVASVSQSCQLLHDPQKSKEIPAARKQYESVFP